MFDTSGGESRQGVFRWKRSLMEEEKMLESEIIDKVQRVLLNEYEKDKWNWPINEYLVKKKLFFDCMRIRS